MTNRELAKDLGISPAALSLIINSKPGISQNTRERVLRALNEMGLSNMIKKPQPDPAGGNTICFVVYKRHGRILDFHSFFLLLMESIENYARRFNFDLRFLSVDRRHPMDGQISHLKSMDCKGIIIFATEMLEDDMAYFQDLRVPCVVLDNDFPLMNLDVVAINNLLGTHQAVEYLVRLGHTRIGYLQSSVYIQSFHERSEGFLQALKHFNLALDPKYIFKLDYTEEGSYQEFLAMLSQGVELPTALFSDDDTIAVGAIKALREHGLSVPRDVSVIGFNNRPAYKKATPALTTINVPKFAFGAMAVDLLLKHIGGDNLQGEEFHAMKYRIGTELVVRDSVERRN